MAQPGEFRYRVDPNGMLYVERYGETDDGGDWYYHEGDIPPDRDMSGKLLTVPPIVSSDPNIDTQRANELRRESIQKEKSHAMRNATETWSRGEAAVQRRDAAEDMSFMDRAKVHAGEFATSMMSGLGDFADFLTDDFNSGKNSGAWGGVPATAAEKAGSSNYARTNERRRTSQESDRLTQELKDYSTGAEFAGELPTYLLTGAAGDLLKLGNTIRPGVLGKPFNNLLDFDSIPLLPNRQLKNLPDDPFRRDLIEEIGTLGAVSAAEGGINPDDTMLMGAIGGGSGAMAGRLLSGRMEAMPDLNTPSTRRVIDRAKEYGYRPSPGIDRNVPGLLADEAGLRSRNEYANMFAMQDRANDQALMRMAADAVGLKLPANSIEINPAILKNHMDELSVRYQQLEGDTRGILNPGTLASVRAKTNLFPETRAGEAARKDLNAWADKLDSLIKNPGQFNGSTYQQFRRELMADYSAATNEGNSQLRSGIMQLVKGLDEGIDTGMRTGLSGSNYVKWKALNEQYAMSSMLKDYGLTPIGTLDSKGLAEHIQRTQQDSMLMTGAQGTPIDDFVNLSQLDYLTRHGTMDKAQSGLSSTSVEAPDKITPNRFFYQTPERSKVSPSDKLRARAYFDYGYPVKTGLLGIPMDSSFRMSQIGRARGQGSDVDQTASDVYNDVNRTYNFIKNNDINILDDGIEKFKSLLGL
jgi:hypothetical protein